MTQKQIEVILTRQLASCLATPIFVVDPAGALIFYNEPAEAILGRRFEETGELPVEAWSTIFKPSTKKGKPIPAQELPLVIALREGRPSFRSFWIRGLDNVLRHINVTAFPLIGQADRHLGAVALFWEADE